LQPEALRELVERTSARQPGPTLGLEKAGFLQNGPSIADAAGWFGGTMRRSFSGFFARLLGRVFCGCYSGGRLVEGLHKTCPRGYNIGRKGKG
jgi:hypothetical protein